MSFYILKRPQIFGCFVLLLGINFITFVRGNSTVIIGNQGLSHNGLPFDFFFFFFLFMASPKAHRGSRARGGIGATAAGLHHSHSNVASQPRL